MDCPDCGHGRTSVVDTRGGADGTTVRRRRECNRCAFRFTTYERPEWETLQVKKRDGSIEPFDPEKVRAGIERAVEKRPVDGEAVDGLVESVHGDLRDRGTRIVSSTLVGELVSERLRETDSVAYLRFVSVYEAFSDPEEFVRELDRIIDDELDGGDGAGGSSRDADCDDGEPDGPIDGRSRDEPNRNETDAGPPAPDAAADSTDSDSHG